MPKRRVKEEKQRKRISKKQILIPPVAVGAATLAGLLVMQLMAPPPVLGICLKAHDVDTFNLHPRVKIVVDGKEKLLPDNVGKQPKNGQECIRAIHTDSVGDTLHIEFVRPVRLSLGYFMKIYSYDNRTINVIDNSSNTMQNQSLILNNYDVQYSYYSEKGEFTKINRLTESPPFTDNMLIKIELRSK